MGSVQNSAMARFYGHAVEWTCSSWPGHCLQRMLQSPLKGFHDHDDHISGWGSNSIHPHFHALRDHCLCDLPPPTEHSGSEPISYRRRSCGGEATNWGWTRQVVIIHKNWRHSTLMGCGASLWYEQCCKAFQVADGRGCRKCVVDSSHMEHDSDKKVWTHV